MVVGMGLDYLIAIRKNGNANTSHYGRGFDEEARKIAFPVVDFLLIYNFPFNRTIASDRFFGRDFLLSRFVDFYVRIFGRV